MYASIRGNTVEATVPRGAMSTTVQYSKQTRSSADVVWFYFVCV